MTYKLFVSEHTYRTEAQQLETLRKIPELRDAPIFRPEDMTTMFRPTQRKQTDTYYAASVACFAPTEEKFKEFLDLSRTKKLCLGSVEEDFEWFPGKSTSGAVKLWREARLKGAYKAGGDMTAATAKARVAEGIKKIKDLWKLPSREYSIKELEELSGVARGSIVARLGNRIPAQINYQAALKRKEKRNANKFETTANEDEPPLMLDQRGRLMLGKDTPRYKRLMEEFWRMVEEARHGR